MSRNNQQNLISAYVQRDDSTASAALDSERPTPPDRKLPPELLSLIFHLHTFSQADYAMSVEKARNPTRDIEVEITCTPMQLSWVCSYWRQAILQDHALWASLFISMFELHGDSLSTVIDLFVGFIAQRSGDIPLKIKIQGYYCDGAPQWRLLDKLLFFTARCTHIVLDANDWTRHASRLLRRSHASSLIDNVDGLSLLFESDESAATSIDGQEPQSMAPKTPFPNLTYLEIGSINIYRFNLKSDFFLFTFPKLQTLTSSNMHCGPHLGHGFPSLVILRIKNLYLERATLDTFLAFFPTLRTISLEKVREYSKLGTGAYAAYPNLAELYLEVQCIDAWAGIMLPNARIIEIGEELFPLLDADDVSRLGRFLKQCPSVTDLKVDITFWNPLQFALLVQTVLSEHTLYPRLRSLSIRVGSAACLQDPERVGWLQHLMRLAQWKSRRRMESANSDHTFVEFSRFQMIMWPHRSSMTTPLPDEEDQESFRIIRDRLSSVGVETVILWSGSPYYFE